MEVIEIPNFTIMSMVRDRHYNLSRLFKFYSNVKCRKIIGDGTEKPYDGEIPDDWEYIHYGKIHYLDRTRANLYRVETEFVIENSDDDLFVPEAAKECVQFLEENKDFSVCDGEVYEFDGSNFKMKYPVSLNRVIRDQGMNKEDVFERLGQHFCHSVFPRNHSINRTEIVQEAFNTICANDHLRSMNILDRFLTMTLLIHGKFKTFEKPMYIRQVGDRLIDRPEIDTIWSRKEFQENLDFNHLHHLGEMIRSVDPIYQDIEENVERIQKILNRHFQIVLPILHWGVDQDFSIDIGKHIEFKQTIDIIRETMKK